MQLNLFAGRSIRPMSDKDIEMSIDDGDDMVGMGPQKNENATLCLHILIAFILFMMAFLLLSYIEVNSLMIHDH